MNLKERRELLEKMAKGYTVTEKRVIKSVRKKRDGSVVMAIVNEEEVEKYIPPNLKALELLYPNDEF